MRPDHRIAMPANEETRNRTQAVIEAAVVFCVTLAYFAWKLAHWNGTIDFDGHYHVKVAQWLAKTGLWFDIPWLPYTVLGERGPDYVWLWHWLLVPFTWIDDPVQRLVSATAVNAAATAAAFAFVMRMLNVPAAPLFALLAISASDLMPYRLMMLRGQNIALIFTLLALWAMARRKHMVLGLVAFLFMQSYHAAVILGPVALIASAACSLEDRKVVIAPLLAVAAGLSCALILSPWFPRHLEYLIFHVLYKKALLGEQLSSLVGSEWYPPGWRNVLRHSWPTHLMLGAALGSVAWRWARDQACRPSTELSIAVGVAFLALGLQFMAVRYVEYYVPFAVLAAGLALRDALPVQRRRRLWTVLAGLWSVVASSVGVAAVEQVRVVPLTYLARVGEALDVLGRPGDIVFNTAWTDFTALVWRADRVRYVNGLDGHYLAYGDPARFALWITMGAGRVEDPVGVLRTVFKARFVVVSPPHAVLAEQLRQSPRVTLRVQSPDGWLFEILPPNDDGARREQ